MKSKQSSKYEDNGELVKELEEKTQLIEKLKDDIQVLKQTLAKKQRFDFTDKNRIIITDEVLKKMLRKDRWSKKSLNKIVAKINDNDEIELHISMKEE